MTRIDLLTKAIDKALIERNKNFMTLGQANKILFEDGHITELEKKNQFLKKLLENGEITNAKQTENSPKQWRIFLSDKRLKRKKTPAKKTSYTQQQSMNVNRVELNNNSWKWIVGVIIALIFIFGLMSDDGSATSEYKITNDTYAATSKQNFDEMFDYIADNDNYALNLMILDGQVKMLKRGLTVRLVKNHFYYSVIREQGSRKNYWVVTDHIGK